MSRPGQLWGVCDHAVISKPGGVQMARCSLQPPRDRLFVLHSGIHAVVDRYIKGAVSQEPHPAPSGGGNTRGVPRVTVDQTTADVAVKGLLANRASEAPTPCRQAAASKEHRS